MIFRKAVICTHIDSDTVVVKLDNGIKERVRFIGINCTSTDFLV
ncbi:hypothetical protein [Clostridium sp. DJ247]|nr:hypothetical protein [Clostridium sp. DJ247]